MATHPAAPARPSPARLRLARDQVALAVDRLRLARADVEMMDEYPDGPAVDPFNNLAVGALVEAENRLAGCVLAVGGVEGYHGLGRESRSRLWPARGVRWHGRVYLALPHPDLTEADGERGQVLTQLVEIDADAVVDLDWPGPENAREESEPENAREESEPADEASAETPCPPGPRGNHRPGTRTFTVATADVTISRESRVGLTLEDLIAAELADYREGERGAAALGIDADAYALQEEDRAIWEAGRLLAAVLPRTGGPPRAVRFGDQAPTGVPAEGEREVLAALKALGRAEALRRLYLAGPYRSIADVIDRFGTDGMAELDRQADIWGRDREVIARSAGVLGSIDIPGIKRLMGRAQLDDPDDLLLLEQALEAFELARSILRGRIDPVEDKLAEAG